MLAAVSLTVALVGLFVVLPFFVAGGVLALISWRADKGTPPVRTSDVLRTGEPATAEVLALRNMGTVLDVRPMVRIGLRITPAQGGEFDLEVTQSIPRAGLRLIRVGERVTVRVLPDRSSAALVTSEL